MDSDLQLSDLHFEKLRGIVYDHTGISIGDGRKSLLLSRLRSRLREIELGDFKAYISLVTSDKDELQELINRVTTNKTYFYRTPRIWEHFRDVAVDAFLKSGANRPMRVWSAAASTGEEAHTVGILLEEVRTCNQPFDYKIVGSDISSRVLKTAEAGVYDKATINKFRTACPDLVRKYVTGDDANGFHIDASIKSRISFKLHNLQKRFKSTGPFDVVFLRNVLIYFTPEDQEGILANIREMMPPDGTLYIGESESLSRLTTDFDIVEPMIYRPCPPGRGPVA